MKKTSAGILLFRNTSRGTEFLLIHFGGPFWKNKHRGAWSIPKGEPETGEELLETAVREFYEETGFSVTGRFLPLTPIVQAGGKTVHAWAVEMDLAPEKLKSNLVTIPSKTGGKAIEFPEVDKAGWFTVPECEQLMLPRQIPLVRELLQKLAGQT